MFCGHQNPNILESEGDLKDVYLLNDIIESFLIA